MNSSKARFAVSIIDDTEWSFIESPIFCIPRLEQMQIDRSLNLENLSKDQVIAVTVLSNSVKKRSISSIELNWQSLSQVEFDWNSSIDGFLGTGYGILLSDANLTSGLHEITASGKTSSGEEVTAIALVTVI